jgi:hypothetical protein
MPTTRRNLAGLLLALLIPVCFAGQEPGPLEAGRNNVAPDKTPNATVPAPASTAPTNTAMPSAPSSVAQLDAETRSKYQIAMRGYYDYVDRGYAYRMRVFEWQMLSSRLIFGIVLLMVLAGLIFAAIQFYVAMLVAMTERARIAKLIAAGEKPTAAAAAGELASELDIGSKGVTVKSSVLGVIVLALSLAFFYLYLVYVYPLHETI